MPRPAQVWALQEGSALHAAGRTNRATVAFTAELEAAYQQVPETPPGQSVAGGAAASGAGANGAGVAEVAAKQAEQLSRAGQA